MFEFAAGLLVSLAMAGEPKDTLMLLSFGGGISYSGGATSEIVSARQCALVQANRPDGAWYVDCVPLNGAPQK